MLNATAGQTYLRHLGPTGEILRNDIGLDRAADTHLDVAELATHYPENHLNALPFEHELENQESRTQLGHVRLVKENFNYLLKPGGIVIELSYQTSCMPSRMGYDQVERTMFSPVGQYKPVLGSIDQNVQTGLAAFTTINS